MDPNTSAAAFASLKISGNDTSPPSSLLRLPNELIFGIFSVVTNFKDLSALSRTCSRLNVVAEQVLYRHLQLPLSVYEKGSKAPVPILMRQSSRCVQRAEAVRSLLISVPRTEEEAQDISSLLSDMKSLRDIQIRDVFYEDPDMGDMYADISKILDLSEGLRASKIAWIRFQQLIQALKGLPSSELAERPFGSLQRVTLRWTSGLTSDGVRLWDCSDVDYLFVHPTITHLSLSNAFVANLTAPQRSNLSYGTPLLRLEFEQCTIAATALGAILSVPKALQYLVIGETVVLAKNHHPLSDEPEELFLALKQQNHSLKCLRHTHHSRPYSHDPAGKRRRTSRGSLGNISEGFLTFEELEVLELSAHPSHVRQSSHTVHMPLSCTAMSLAVGLGPPKLHTLRLVEFDWHTFVELIYRHGYLDDHIKAMIHGLIPHLHELHIQFGSRMQGNTRQLWQSLQLRKKVTGLGNTFKKHGVRLKMYLSMSGQQPTNSKDLSQPKGILAYDHEGMGFSPSMMPMFPEPFS